MPRNLGDISPERKRQIARPPADNGPVGKKKTAGDALQHHGAKLVDAVHVLAANLNRLIEWQEARGGQLTSNQAIADKIGGSSNTIGRMRRGDGSARIGTVSAVAKAFGLNANQLLTPGLNPEDPPEIVADDAEKRLLHAFRDRRRPQDQSPPAPPAKH